MYDRPKDPTQKCLHSYTIKEAIGDGAVLGFKIQGLGFRRSTLEDIAIKLNILNESQIEEKSDKELEAIVVKAYAQAFNKNLYDDDRHRLDVIDYIVNRSSAKLGLDAPNGEAFEGMLTVPSIEIAQKYYKLFKQFIADGKVSEEIRKRLPDFPKIAITYSVGENEDGAMANQAEMMESLKDYNAMFGTSWDLSTIGAYNAELNERLARKKSKYFDRSQQLDLVIVVDRLLTGFDAPCLSTIFLDRQPMKPQHLIQAFSRTNRIFTKKKKYGEIVTLQSPDLYAEKIDEALKLYTNGGISDVQAPTWEVTALRLVKAIEKLRKIAPNIAAVDEISRRNELDEMVNFARAYQLVDRLLGEVAVYDEYREEMLGTTFDITRAEFDELTARYHNIIEQIKDGGDEQPDSPIIKDFDVNYELESIKRVEVNYRYLVNLLQAHIPAGETVMHQATPEQDQRIVQYIEDFKKNNPKVGEILSQLWFELKLNPEDFRDMDAFTLIEARVDEVQDQLIEDFSKQWGINPVTLKQYANSVQTADISAKTVDASMGDYAAYKARGGTATKLKYLRELREAVAAFVRDEIKPLAKR